MKSEDIDWNAIASRIAKVEDTRIQTGKIADRDFWILKAGCASKKRQLATDAASLLTAQIRRWEQSWIDNIEFMAKQEGVTFEEMFIRLAIGE
jgi:hypothetical protein